MGQGWNELLITPLPETVWKFRISSTLGSHKRSRRGQRCHFAALSTINMNAREPSSDFPDSLSTLDFSHLAMLHTASVRPSTKVLGTFAVSLSCDDPQKVALEKNLEVLAEAS